MGQARHKEINKWILNEPIPITLLHQRLYFKLGRCREFVTFLAHYIINNIVSWAKRVYTWALSNVFPMFSEPIISFAFHCHLMKTLQPSSLPLYKTCAIISRRQILLLVCFGGLLCAAYVCNFNQNFIWLLRGDAYFWEQERGKHKDL